MFAGQFYITSPIVVANFDGHFTGAGKEATIIQTRGNTPFPLATDGPTPGLPNLFLFYQTQSGTPTLKFSDMTLRFRGRTEEFRTHFPANVLNAINFIGVRGKVTGVEDFEVSHFNTSFERMGFEGETGDFSFGRNGLNGILIHGETIFQRGAQGTFFFKYAKPTTGTHTVTNCTFKNISFAIGINVLRDSEIRVGGSRSTKNTFVNAALPVNFKDLSNSTVEVSFNEDEGSNTEFFSIFIQQAVQAVFGVDLGPIPELFPEPSRFLISHNTIHALGFADAVGLQDFALLVGADKTLEAVVSNNKIILENTLFGGIVGIFAEDALVSNNQITGTGLAGVYGGVFGDTVVGWTIQGNNVENVNATSPLFPISAPILLGPGTSNCTVVGGNAKTNVLDFGINNILVGVNNMGQGKEVGQALKDAMEQKLEILKSVRGF